MAKVLFKREEVIEHAIKLFGQHGYTGTSMQQIIEVTGLQAGSIYHAFGNKEGLYKEALKQYSDKSIQRITRVVEAAPNVQLGICSALEDIIDASMAKDYCSCFLLKTQIELAASDTSEDGLYAFSLKRLAQTEELYKSYLQVQYDSEESAAKATSIMLHIFGLRVYGYQKKSAQKMRAGLVQGLPWLPWSNPHN
ncbi:MAG: TetR/AcrR family transcriptional regulator [Oceanospirillaceae bacterium]